MQFDKLIMRQGRPIIGDHPGQLNRFILAESVPEFNF